MCARRELLSTVGFLLFVWTVVSPADITVTNTEDNAVYRHPLAILRGALTDRSLEAVSVTNRTSPRPLSTLTGPALDGRFVALAELVPGANELALRAEDHETTLRLVYRPQTTPWRVRLFYLVDSSGSTEYQTPLTGDTRNWRGKLGTAALLMQSFTAEDMNRQGYGRRTFNLEFDDQGSVVIHLLRGDRTAEQYRELDGQALWRHCNELIARQFPDDTAKNLVICAFTRFDPASGQIYSHTALGGGNVALFGGGNIFAWPDSVADVHRAFSDPTAVDPARIFSDSVGRHTLWAIASTTIGACLHELGHTFGLPHTRHPHDIMTRGIDRFNRVFTLVEPAHARRGTPYVFRDDEIAVWAPPSAAAIAFTPPFLPDPAPPGPAPRTTIGTDLFARTLTVGSANGIRFVGFDVDGDCVKHAVPDPRHPAPRDLTIHLEELASGLYTEQIRIRAVDATGHTAVARVPELLSGPFVQRWRLAPTRMPWPRPEQFPEVTEDRLEAITAGALRTPLMDAGMPFIDLLHWLPPDEREHTAAYLVRTIRAPAAKTVHLLTGSDDALRIWLNGTPVQAVLKLRGAAPAQERTPLELNPGDNTLTVEVSQALGGFGFYLQITDPDRGALALLDDGSLRPAASDAHAARAILRGPFVRTWHIAPKTRPWTDRTAFVPLSEEDRDDLLNAALGLPPIHSSSHILDLTEFVPNGTGPDTVAYAACSIHTDSPRGVRMLTGSDDALRVWVNGTLCQQVLALRGTVPDAEAAVVNLRAGQNQLLAEVSQATGAWGVVLRFESLDGTRLCLDEHGRLVPFPFASTETDR